jgi:hypothetical protein
MNATAPHSATRNFLLNDHGGVTYAPRQYIGQPEARSDLLADVRALADATHDLCTAHRNFWPERYPVPEDVHCALLGADYGLARVRGGTLKRLAEQDTAPSVRHEPGTYSVTQADLIDIKDAIAHLETYRQMLVDQPGEQHLVQAYIQRLHGIIDRASERAGGRDGARKTTA